MSDGEQLGVTESVAIALGGMIGGGIFAVLGVVAEIAGAATWFAFVLAGVVAVCAGYSYDRLNVLSRGQGGSVSFVQCFLGKTTLAGMTGWTLLFGYVGSMAMYAYAFGSFTVGLNAVPDAVLGVPLRPLVSVAAVAAFVALNLMGAQATGTVENLLVGAKVAILLAFGIGGLAYGAGRLELGVGHLLSPSPVEAAAVSFVAFQGWQLLFYDQESIRDATSTIRRALYTSIACAVGIYVIVAVTTLNLAPREVIRTHPERALAVAADPFIPHGFTIMSVAALFSTGSAINATLFSTGYLAKGMVSSDLLPDRAGDSSAGGAPGRTVLLLGGIVSVLTVIGSLGAITSFASLAFLLLFGAMSWIALRQRHREEVHPLPPAVGLGGSAGFFVLMISYLYREEPATLWAVLAIAAVVLAAELLYFERDIIRQKIRRIEELEHEFL